MTPQVLLSLVAVLFMSGCAEISSSPKFPGSVAGAATFPMQPGVTPPATAGKQKPLVKVETPAPGEIVWSEFGRPLSQPLDKMEVSGRKPREYGLLGVPGGLKLWDGPYMIGFKRGRTLWLDDGYIGWVIVKIGDLPLKGMDFRDQFAKLRATPDPIPITVRSRFGKEEELIAHLDERSR